MGRSPGESFLRYYIMDLARLSWQGQVVYISGELYQYFSVVFVAMSVVKKDLYLSHLPLIVEAFFEGDMCLRLTFLDKSQCLDHLAGLEAYVGHVLSSLLRDNEPSLASNGWQWVRITDIIVLNQGLDGVLDTELADRFSRIYEA